MAVICTDVTDPRSKLEPGGVSRALVTSRQYQPDDQIFLDFPLGLPVFGFVMAGHDAAVTRPIVDKVHGSALAEAGKSIFQSRSEVMLCCGLRSAEDRLCLIKDSFLIRFCFWTLQLLQLFNLHLENHVIQVVQPWLQLSQFSQVWHPCYMPPNSNVFSFCRMFNSCHQLTDVVDN